jgi:hypothetical protein
MERLEPRARERMQELLLGEWHARVEYKIDRSAWHLTKIMLDMDRIGALLTSRMTQTSRPSASHAPPPPTKTTTTSPQKKDGHTRRLLAMARNYGAKIALYLFEKVLPILWQLIAPLLMGLWAFGSEGVQRVWSWTTGILNWVYSLV